MEKFTLEILSKNKYGALNRITGLYTRKGYNIDWITSKEAESDEFLILVITSRGDSYAQTYIVRQLEKLYDVIDVTLIKE